MRQLGSKMVAVRARVILYQAISSCEERTSLLTDRFVLMESSTRRRRSYDEPFLQVTPESARAAKRAEMFRRIGVIAVTASIGFIWGLWSADSAFSALTSVSKTQH